MLSVVKLARGQAAEALRLISEAMRMRKPSPQILLNYGMILHALDRSEEALAELRCGTKAEVQIRQSTQQSGTRYTETALR
jgi:hypothetical protein